MKLFKLLVKILSAIATIVLIITSVFFYYESRTKGIDNELKKNDTDE